MTIDERLEFLRQSTESLHASCQELHAAITRQAEENQRQAKAQEEKHQRMRRAILQAIAAYLREDGIGEKDGEA